MITTEYISQFLREKGIDTVFELQGGMITRILDELHRQGDIKIVTMHHEQGASFAADAYARVTGKPGVALATSGPGATNLITGIGSCFFDSVPAIFITGQVNFNELKGDNGIRQLGFQETDIVSIVKPITKAAYAIKNADEIPQVLEEAYRISLSGRPGPVLIDIPMNIQKDSIAEISITLPTILPIKLNEINQFLNEIKKQLKGSKKPLVLVGRGIRTAFAIELFIEFIEKYNLPVVTTLLGLDVIPYNHPNRIGFIGAYGNRWANYALSNCDVLIVLGSRLDIRQTGADVKSFQNNKKIFHVDIEKAELNNRLKNCCILESDLKEFLIVTIDSYINEYNFEEWREEIKSKNILRPDTQELENIKGINPNEFIHSLSKKATEIKAFVADVGNNQMWVAQSLELQKNQMFITSGGMGAMGYSLPAGIGASFGLKLSPVVVISGDGGFQINIQELQTIKRNKLPIKIIILNNNCLGMIRQFQDSYFESCYYSTVWGYDAPDFEAVARAYGIKAITIDKSEQIDNGLVELFNDLNEPMLLNVKIDMLTNAFPKLAFGMPLSKMEPFTE